MKVLSLIMTPIRVMHARWVLPSANISPSQEEYLPTLAKDYLATCVDHQHRMVQGHSCAEAVRQGQGMEHILVTSQTAVGRNSTRQGIRAKKHSTAGQQHQIHLALYIKCCDHRAFPYRFLQCFEPMAWLRCGVFCFERFEV